MAGCHSVKCTTDARQALTLFIETEPDIVLLDLNMPHFTGFEVLEQLKAVHRQVFQAPDEAAALSVLSALPAPAN